MSVASDYAGPILIEIDRIDPRPAIDMRAEEKAEVISDYAENFDDLPPIRLIADADDKHWTEDGSYRLRAARKLGKTLVPCLIKRGTFEDAFRDASRANMEKGPERVTNADKHARVRAAIDHPVMGRWSQVKIAETCNVSQQFVGLVQRQHYNDCNVVVDAPTVVEGKDGNLYPAKKRTLTHAELTAKRAAILEDLQTDPTTPDTVIGKRHDTDGRMVSKVRKDNNIPPSGSKGGAIFHRPKPSATPPLSIVQEATDCNLGKPEISPSIAARIEASPLAVEPEPLPVVVVQPEPVAVPVIAPALAAQGRSELTAAALDERWRPVAASIRTMFMSWPGPERPFFADRLDRLADELFDLCPEVVTTGPELLS